MEKRCWDGIPIPGGEWKVQNGAIVGRSDKQDTRHGLLVTDKAFENFEVEVRYKAITGNSGLYFRAEEMGGVVGVHGFQAEIDPNNDAGGLYETGGREWVVKPAPDPGTHMVQARKMEYHDGTSRRKSHHCSCQWQKNSRTV
jgi:hypothetical protein